MAWQNDTLVPEAQQQLDEDPQKTGSGKADAPGGARSPNRTQRDITVGAENGPDNDKSDPTPAGKSQNGQ